MRRQSIAATADRSVVFPGPLLAIPAASCFGGAAIVLGFLASCATAPPGDADAGVGGGRDAALEIDSGSDPDAGGCSQMEINLLSNGDFEGGQQGWIESTNGPSAVIRQQGAGLPFSPNDGEWAAIVGGFNDADVSIVQRVTIDEDATTISIAGSACWVTEEVIMAPVDLLTIEAIDPNGGATIATLDSASNEDAGLTCEWTSFEYALPDVAADALDLRIHATTDGDAISTFAFDTLVLRASVCR